MRAFSACKRVRYGAPYLGRRFVPVLETLLCLAAKMAVLVVYPAGPPTDSRSYFGIIDDGVCCIVYIMTLRHFKLLLEVTPRYLSCVRSSRAGCQAHLRFMFTIIWIIRLKKG